MGYITYIHSYIYCIYLLSSLFPSCFCSLRFCSSSSASCDAYFLSTKADTLVHSSAVGVKADREANALLPTVSASKARMDCTVVVG